MLSSVLLVASDAEFGPPCGAAAWNSAPRNCCSAASIALEDVDVDDVDEVELVDEEADVDAVDVLSDDVTPNCASAAAIAATSGFVVDASLVDVEEEVESLCD